MVIDVLANEPFSTDAATVAALHATETVILSSGDRPMTDESGCVSICGTNVRGSKDKTPPMTTSGDAHGMSTRPYSWVAGNMLRKRTVRVEAKPVMTLEIA